MNPSEAWQEVKGRESCLGSIGKAVPKKDPFQLPKLTLSEGSIEENSRGGDQKLQGVGNESTGSMTKM